MQIISRDNCGLALLLTSLFAQPLLAQSLGPNCSAAVESSEDELIYSTVSTNGLEGTDRISQYGEILDKKNYVIRTTTQVPVVNGGERIDSQIIERSQQIGKTGFEVERMIESPDRDGRLITCAMIRESYQVVAKGKEIERKILRLDANGRLTTRRVERESVSEVAPGERKLTKNIYRLNIEGELALSAKVEELRRQLNDRVSVVERIQRSGRVNGDFIPVAILKETTTEEDSTIVKETLVRKADFMGHLKLTEKSKETITLGPGGTRYYEQLLESHNVIPQMLYVEDGLILSRRVTGKECKLKNGTIQSRLQIETLDSINLSDGLTATQLIITTSRLIGSGQVEVEQITKVRNSNGDFVLAQRTLKIIQEKKLSSL